ncbi:FAD-dependent oxidoreductase [Streptomyces apocyni]|uniref:FAD-dependent oxidoreductase n=1 Tax=Streptomyces apocyni TaxID=2654677 RepID=UPI0012E99B0E|nr:FAD-binding oxidoreductase [Streptomyces apocyni]
MDRRSLLTATAAALTASACATHDDPRTDTTADATADAKGGASPARSPTRSRTRSPTPDWPALAQDLDGTLVRPGEAHWDTARQLYNRRFDDLRPTAVAYATHADDIRTALAFARRTQTPVALRNGGHSYTGWSSGDGRLIIDVSPLDKISVRGSTATIGAGARLIGVYRALAAQGVTLPAGTCPSVGITGLTLGGGHGVGSRAYGLTCDSLTQATLVTADGTELVCDDEKGGRHRDLFWALRGAGNGNFGVVTELRFRTHPAPRAVSAYLNWPWSQARQLLTAWQRWGPDQPDEIWSSLNFAAEPGARPTYYLTVFSLGGYDELQNAVDRLADAVGSSPSRVIMERRDYLEAMDLYAGCAGRTDAQCRLPGTTPGRDPEGVLRRGTYASRSDFFDRSLPDAGVRTLLGQLERLEGMPREAGSSGSMLLTALGGAVNRVAPDATAFVHRRSRMLAQYIGAWEAGTPGSVARGWLKTTHDALRPYTSGAAYQNYPDPTLPNWRTAYYGSAAPWLAEVKKRYDPARLFDFPQAI